MIVKYIIIYSTNEIYETILCYFVLQLVIDIGDMYLNQIDYYKIVDSSYHYHN